MVSYFWKKIATTILIFIPTMYNNTTHDQQFNGGNNCDLITTIKFMKVPSAKARGAS